MNAATMPKAEKRSANFTKDEEYLLVSLVDKYKNIIENKKSGVNTWKEKEKVWRKVEDVFNSQCTSNGRRSAKVLKEKFRNLKKKTKEKFSRVKVEINKTGGGQYVPPLITEMDEAVKNIMGNIQISGVPNSYDCDDNLTEKTTQESKALASNMNTEEVDEQNYCFIEEPLTIDPGCSKSHFEIVDMRTEDLSTDFQDSDTDLPHTSSGNLTTECRIVDKRKSDINVSAKETPSAKKIKLTSRKTRTDNNNIAEHDWSTYCPKNLQTPVSTKLQINRPKNQGQTHQKKQQKYVSINAQLIGEKLEFVRMQKEKFLDEHAIKMQILKKTIRIIGKRMQLLATMYRNLIIHCMYSSLFLRVILSSSFWYY